MEPSALLFAQNLVHRPNFFPGQQRTERFHFAWHKLLLQPFQPTSPFLSWQNKFSNSMLSKEGAVMGGILPIVKSGSTEIHALNITRNAHGWNALTRVRKSSLSLKPTTLLPIASTWLPRGADASW